MVNVQGAVVANPAAITARVVAVANSDVVKRQRRAGIHDKHATGIVATHRNGIATVDGAVSRDACQDTLCKYDRGEPNIKAQCAATAALKGREFGSELARSTIVTWIRYHLIGGFDAANIGDDGPNDDLI